MSLAMMKKAVIAMCLHRVGRGVFLRDVKVAPGPGRASPVAKATTPAGQLVSTYCVSCHNQKLRTANLALDTADAEQVINSAETWEKVVVQLRSRSMPPPRSRRPDAATYDAAAGWLESELDRAAVASPNPGRPPALHRLNRTEYANAIRDLLGIEIDGTSMLPPDEQAHGFDNIADALTVTPALQVRYLTAAAKISRLAIGDPTIPAGFERYTAAKNNSNERTQLWHHERSARNFRWARAAVSSHATISPSTVSMSSGSGSSEPSTATFMGCTCRATSISASMASAWRSSK